MNGKILCLASKNATIFNKKTNDPEEIIDYYHDAFKKNSFLLTISLQFLQMTSIFRIINY